MGALTNHWVMSCTRWWIILKHLRKGLNPLLCHQRLLCKQHLPLYLSTDLYICLCIYVCIYLSICLQDLSAVSTECIPSTLSTCTTYLHYLTTLLTDLPTCATYSHCLPTYTTYLHYLPTYLSIHPSIYWSIYPFIHPITWYLCTHLLLQSLQESREMNNRNCCQVWCKSCSSDLRFWRCFLCLTQKRHWVILGLNHRTDTGQHNTIVVWNWNRTNIMLKIIALLVSNDWCSGIFS